MLQAAFSFWHERCIHLFQTPATVQQLLLPLLSQALETPVPFQDNTTFRKMMLPHATTPYCKANWDTPSCQTGLTSYSANFGVAHQTIKRFPTNETLQEIVLLHCLSGQQIGYRMRKEWSHPGILWIMLKTVLSQRIRQSLAQLMQTTAEHAASRTTLKWTLICWHHLDPR